MSIFVNDGLYFMAKPAIFHENVQLMLLILEYLRALIYRERMFSRQNGIISHSQLTKI